VRSFKTSECELSRECTDAHACLAIHAWEDESLARRRDPFAFYYDAEACNDSASGACERGSSCPYSHTLVERMDHPTLHKHALCRNARACKKRHCAFAHSQEDQTLAQEIERHWERLWSGSEDAISIARAVSSDGTMTNKQLQLKMFVPEEAEPRPPVIPELVRGWDEEPISPSSAGPSRASVELVPLNHMQALAVGTSHALWSSLDKTAALHLCKLKRYQPLPDAPVSLLLQGRGACDARQAIEATLRHAPGSVFVQASQTFPKLAVERVRASVESEGQLAFNEGDESVWVSANCAADDDSGTVVVRAINHARGNGRQRQLNAAQHALNRIRFWLRKAGYDKVFPCSACLEEFNRDDLVSCPAGGHFFCTASDGDAADGCFGLLLGSERATLHAHGGQLACPLCRADFAVKELATRVAPHVFATLQHAAVEARAAKRYDELQLEFDKHLQQKTAELVERYANRDLDLFKLPAQAGAAKARATVLNLACPHCKAVYAEFAGCMALQCASCKKQFCAYCHQ
jgi:hypothetical protein